MDTIGKLTGFAVALSFLSLAACSGALPVSGGDGLRECPSHDNRSVTSLRTPCRKVEGVWYSAAR